MYTDDQRAADTGAFRGAFAALAMLAAVVGGCYLAFLMAWRNH